MNLKINISFYLLFIVSLYSFSQEDSRTRKEFDVKVQVLDENTYKSIENATVQVNGRSFLYSFIHKRYIVKAIANDELVVSHPDFETVYYTILDDEDIKILVKDFQESKYSRSKTSKRKKGTDNYQVYLDSANFYKKKDIEKSLSFLEQTLQNSSTKTRQAKAYTTLGEVYLFWKQYDLAISNFRESQKLRYTAATQIQLAKSEFLYKSYTASEQSFKKAFRGKLTNYERLTVYEGLGDIYAATKQFAKAKTNYNLGLQLAKTNLITPKITDLNSKLAQVFAVEGKTQKADTYFKNSLDLASKENVKRSLKEQEKVADFYNKSRRYDEEIQLRKKSLKEAEESLNNTKKVVTPEAITSQKINYKIGNAYIQKEDYKEAIPFLKKSIDDADKEEDIVVQKDATRKLSEVYATVGDYTKALKSYQDYVKLVDASYVKKEQEIQQSKRLNKKISENQSRITSLEKDKQLTESKIDLAYKDQQLTEESNKRQQFIIYSLLAGIILLSLLAYLMFRTNKQQKLANNLLALKSMRSQMNPHFIFNALNSVNSFIAVNDERSANRYLSEFSTLMRSVLENSDEDFIPLSKEIELLTLYVKLEHNRFKEKFDYQINIDNQIQLEDYAIPPMLLQPYIENAIWHGLRYKKEKGNLEIAMKQNTTNTVLITIQDDGVGRKQSMEMKTKNQLKQKSKGMSTIKNRVAILNNMYQDKISVEVTDVFEDGSGTKVSLILKKK